MPSASTVDTSCTMLVAMEDALLVHPADEEGHITLDGTSCRCIAADPSHRGRIYLGTANEGLLRSDDAGESWSSVGRGIRSQHITAVSVGTKGVVYAGTEPSEMFRSEDGGESWRHLEGLTELPSSRSWSFPPRPSTHHVRWISPDPHRPGRIFVAIEAGALVRSPDGGRRWRDRTPDGPRDTHTLVIHPTIRGRIYSAAGDGFFESDDGGETWRKPMSGLRHRYVWGCAVSAAEPDVVIVSASTSPREGHSAIGESLIYRKMGEGPWEAMWIEESPSQGTTLSTILADEEGAFYVANNRGVFRSRDAGSSWRRIDSAWHERFRKQEVAGMTLLPAS